jgi:broad specificity phosphatase PhoE
MPRLFLIRHGEPEAAWGEGPGDPGLSERGRAQAQQAARALAPIATLVSSPMRRCRETAAPAAAALGLTPRIDARVSEIAAPAGVPDRRVWLQQNFPWRGGEGRDWATLDSALHVWRAELLGAVVGAEADVAVFTHFVAINALVGAALGSGRTIVCRPDFASITELYNQGGTLRLVSIGAEMSAGDVL